MLKILPKWYSKAEEKINRAILDIVSEENINITFVLDSQIINDSKYNILSKLVQIQEQAQGNVPKEYIEELAKHKKPKKKK